MSSKAEKPKVSNSVQSYTILCMVAGYGISQMEVSKWYKITVQTFEAIGEGFFGVATFATSLFGSLSGFQLIISVVLFVIAFFVCLYLVVKMIRG